MLQNLRELYNLLTLEQRKKLFKLQILIVGMSFAEIASVIAIGPFMGLVGDMSQLQGDGIVASIYQASSAETPQSFLFWLGIGVFVMLVAAGLFSMYTVWRLALYGSQVGAELSSRLFKHYMHQPWLFHAEGSSGQLINQISQESQRVTNFIISPLMQMNAKLVMVILMAVAILIYNPMVAIIGVSLFALSYLLIYRLVKKRLTNNGARISQQQTLRFRLMSDGFGGVKDTLLLGRQQVLVDRFEDASRAFARSHGVNQALNQMPRYAIEIIAFGAIIALVLYLLYSRQGNLGDILPALSVYALAGFKLLPAFQRIYVGIANIKGNMAAFESIRDGLIAGSTHYQKEGFDGRGSAQPIALNENIEFRGVRFTYPGKQDPALKDISLSIPANQVIGLVGSSGSGKSTAIDLLLGLIKPDAGCITIDGVPLTDDNRRAWQNKLGFVSQSIFLSDSSIRENIAFGLPPEAIDEEKVRRAASMAHLDEMLAELPAGLDTFVGERGVQLSGGQRQRIGIARALYEDTEVLVLDEATSALDGITEKLIMDAIHDFSGEKTIIMIAHRLATVKQCDQILLLNQGKVVDQGKYADLVGRNDMFKRMAQHA
nr:ABC transporter ATP-binding protein [uncultured Halomonas sp.]